MRIGPYDEVSRPHHAFFRQQGVLYADLAALVVMSEPLLEGELLQDFTLVGRLMSLFG